MKIDNKLWENHQYDILMDFIHYIAFWRCSYEAYVRLDTESELWTKTIDAYLLRAVVNWCMVFGSYKSEIHWKKVVLEKSDQLDFNNRLLADVGMTEKEWKDYWSDMTDFRNNYVAHRPGNLTHPTVPKMEPAFQAVIAYDEWLRAKIHRRFDFVVNEPILHNLYHRLLRIWAKPLESMIQIGPTGDDE